MGDVRVGCAGWSYRDWVGAVYPAHVTPSHWLETYASLFSIVEIDSTFYAVPSEATTKGWVARAERLPGFTFTAKLHQDITHHALPRGNAADMRRLVDEFLRAVVEPLENAHLLSALLVQLPPTYALFERAGQEDALAALLELLRFLEPRRRKVAVEFRHGSWYEHVGERLVPDVVDALAGLGVCAADVDGLGSRFTDSRTTPWSYLRLHGRRTQIPPSERGLSHAPYNYLYGKEEIAEVAAHVRARESLDASTIVIFNNHYRGQAAHNAMDLIEALGGARPRAAVPFKKESRLDEFGLSSG